jgi:cytochrome b
MLARTEVILKTTVFVFLCEKVKFKMTLPTLNATLSADIAPAKPSRRIVEWPMRLFHTFMAVSFLGAYLTAESERFRLLHVSLGYTLLGLVVFRLLWGVAGPRQSRLSAMWRKLQGIRELAGDVKDLPHSLLKLNAQTWRQWASVVLSGAALLTLMATVFSAVTGYAVYNELTDDWMSEIHEFFGNFMLILVLLHVVVVGLLVLFKKSQGLRPMWSGQKEGTGPDVAKSNHGLVGALLIFAILIFWVVQFF